jgi:hypothetical protein
MRFLQLAIICHYCCCCCDTIDSFGGILSIGSGESHLSAPRLWIIIVLLLYRDIAGQSCCRPFAWHNFPFHLFYASIRERQISHSNERNCMLTDRRFKQQLCIKYFIIMGLKGKAFENKYALIKKRNKTCVYEREREKE